MLNACNSGFWPVAQHLVHAGIGCLVGVQGLYRSLALGLSVDEAVSWARLDVMDDSHSVRREAAVQERAKTARRTQQRASRHDAESVQRQLSDMANVCVLILGRFTEERKAVLDDIRRALTRLDRQYVPILFDFEKASERDLIGSVIRFAGVSRFVIADLSDPKSVPAEL